jgi:hypothetical protein
MYVEWGPYTVHSSLSGLAPENAEKKSTIGVSQSTVPVAAGRFPKPLRQRFCIQH